MTTVGIDSSTIYATLMIALIAVPVITLIMWTLIVLSIMAEEVIITLVKRHFGKLLKTIQRRLK